MLHEEARRILLADRSRPLTRPAWPPPASTRASSSGRESIGCWPVGSSTRRSALLVAVLHESVGRQLSLEAHRSVFRARVHPRPQLRPAEARHRLAALGHHGGNVDQVPHVLLTRRGIGDDHATVGVPHENDGPVLLVERGPDRVGIHIPRGLPQGSRRGYTARQLHSPTTQAEGGERINHAVPPPRPVEDQGAVHEDYLHTGFLSTDACVQCGQDRSCLLSTGGGSGSPRIAVPAIRRVRPSVHSPSSRHCGIDEGNSADVTLDRN
jgi:hypothetical protein